VASDRSSLLELVSGRGFLVDPMRPSLIAAGIVRALSDAGARQTFIARGLEFAREMSWERCARQTLEIYHELKS
jgi:alpha-1,3-rhamnosyl/mannosyltransferase